MRSLFIITFFFTSLLLLSCLFGLFYIFNHRIQIGSNWSARLLLRADWRLYSPLLRCRVKHELNTSSSSPAFYREWKVGKKGIENVEEEEEERVWKRTKAEVDIRYRYGNSISDLLASSYAWLVTPFTRYTKELSGNCNLFTGKFANKKYSPESNQKCYLHVKKQKNKNKTKNTKEFLGMVRGIKILAENKDKGARGPQSSILAHAFSLLSLQSKASRKAFPSGLMKSISSLSTLVFFLLWGWGALPLGFIRHFKVFRSRCCCCCCCWKTEKNLGQMLMLLLWAFSLIKKKKALAGRERDETLRRFISSGFCNNLLSYSRRWAALRGWWILRSTTMMSFLSSSFGGRVFVTCLWHRRHSLVTCSQTNEATLPIRKPIQILSSYSVSNDPLRLDELWAFGVSRFFPPLFLSLARRGKYLKK